MTTLFENVLQNLKNNLFDKNQKLLLAKGFMPLEPKVLAEVLLFLSDDPEPTISDAAKETIIELPLNIVKNLAIAKSTDPELLFALSKLRMADSEILQAIILNPRVSDKTLEFVALHGPAKVVDILAGNQERLFSNRKILDAIFKNENTPNYVLTRLEMLLEEQKLQEKARLESIEEEKRTEAAKVIPPKEKSTVITKEKPHVVKKPSEKPTLKKVKKTYVTSKEKEEKEEIELFEEEKQKDTRTFAQRLMDMSVADKIKLAMLGSREERFHLITEKVRLVAMAALHSPKTTEDEIEQIAKMKNVLDEVLRDIGNNREYRKNNLIRKALLENPRTPVGITLNLIKYVTERELSELARNRNVPDAIRSTAKRMVMQKEMKRHKKK